MKSKAPRARADKDRTETLIRWHKAQQDRHQALADALIEQPAAGPLSALVRRRREVKGWNIQD